MSMSIGSSADAQSYLQSLLQLGAGSGAASAGAASFADPMLSGGQGSSSPIDPSATSGLLGASSSPFQSDTLSSLLSAQGQGSGATAQAGGADGDGDADGSSGGAGNSGNTTTQTTTNPDGSTTTTITYADGSTATTTTPAATDAVSGGTANTNMPAAPSSNGLLDQLGKLQSLLAPAVGTLMAVV